MLPPFLKRQSFTQRITQRDKLFWTAPDAEQLRFTLHNATDPIELWKDSPMWQRKLSNKGNSRNFASKFGVQVPELYWKGSDLSQLNFSVLPEHFVIRPTIGHSTNNVFLLSNWVNHFDKKTYTPELLRPLLQEIVDRRPGMEVLVEEFVTSEAGEYNIPADYKLYMFNGEMAVFQVSHRWGIKKGHINFYDKNWNALSPIRDMYPPGPVQQPPRCFEQMMEAATVLSKAYEIFVRVDFYATPKGVIFGEFTPTPGIGKHYTPYGDKLLNQYWERYTPGSY